jgi:ribosomal protein S18 acetylase RimI-like enzyme
VVCLAPRARGDRVRARRLSDVATRPLNFPVRAQAVGVSVRLASVEDAPVVTDILRRSISQLCVEDHRNDSESLELWLKNKTIPIVRGWFESPTLYCVVGCIDGMVSGSAAMNAEGEVLLCYVDPGARFQGVSAAMILALEKEAQNRRLADIRLSSTITAKRFYQERGYMAIGAPRQMFGLVAGIPMVKRLALQQ